LSDSSGSLAPARVTLINAPSAPGTLANREGAAGMGVVYPAGERFLYPPHTLATVAAALRQAGYSVQLLDLVVSPHDEAALQADVICVLVSWATLQNDLDYIAALRAQTSARILALGSSLRFIAAQVAEGCPADAVLVGEAEGCCVEAVEYVRTNPSDSPRILTNHILRAANCDGDGWTADLAALPFPAWDLVPTSRYPLLSVFASKGCPDGCLYCPYSAAQGHRSRVRSIDSVVDEVAWLAHTFAPERVVFRDPVFAYQRERVVGFCERLIHSRISLRWECESRPEHFDAELLQLMQRAGCTWVKIGLETTDPTVLAGLQRIGSLGQAGDYLRHAAQVVESCQRLGLGCRLFVLSGLPGQDSAAARHTADWVSAVRPTALNVKALELYPGTLEASAPADTEQQMAILLAAGAEIMAAQRPRGLISRARSWLRQLRRRMAR